VRAGANGHGEGDDDDEQLFHNLMY
jgi:hypothetical protein